MKITKLTPSIGAEISGINLAQLAPPEYDAIYDALIEHQVIFFRDQNLSPENHLALAQDFGTPEPPHPVYPHVEGHPQVMLLDFGPDNPPDTDAWHTDVTFKPHPPFASILYSRKIPPVGGDTLWASMTAAYAALPTGLKSELAEMRAIHDMSDFRNSFTVGEPLGRADKLMEAHARMGSAIHPMVKPHPVTGTPMLFCNSGFTVQVEGLTSAASRRLLAYLNDHMQAPEFQVRFHWSEGAVAIWDNRSTMHYAIGDYLPHRRVMNRVTLTNDRRLDERG